jgi:hypothetical protein
MAYEALRQYYYELGDKDLSTINKRALVDKIAIQLNNDLLVRRTSRQEKTPEGKKIYYRGSKAFIKNDDGTYSTINE